ncbi:MAG: hypothetical protein J6Y37_11540 [Paludibacteraceae bacterium]|nr:hypothetical protein [Paludibacteraceae bacterium]
MSDLCRGDYVVMERDGFRAVARFYGWVDLRGRCLPCIGAVYGGLVGGVKSLVVRPCGSVMCFEVTGRASREEVAEFEAALRDAGWVYDGDCYCHVGVFSDAFLRRALVVLGALEPVYGCKTLSGVLTSLRSVCGHRGLS